MPSKSYGQNHMRTTACCLGHCQSDAQVMLCRADWSR